MLNINFKLFALYFNILNCVKKEPLQVHFVQFKCISLQFIYNVHLFLQRGSKPMGETSGSLATVSK